MVSGFDKVQHFVHGGKFLQIDDNREIPEKRVHLERRKTLRGDLSKSETGRERRVGSRRLDEVIITIEMKDPHLVFVNESTFKKMVVKKLEQEFESICKAESVESLLSFIEHPDKILIEVKMRYRDKIKRFATEKGLSFEVVDNGVYLGGAEKETTSVDNPTIQGKTAPVDHETAEISTILGFAPGSLQNELDQIVFKVFVKCLNEVHPVSGDHERDALKQNVSLEQRIIFMAGRHYPKSENFTYKTIVEQVTTELLKEYNKIIQLEAEVLLLEERYQLSEDVKLKPVITAKTEDLNRMKGSTTEETVRTLYLYLDYFKDITKVGAIRERIENIYKKVNEKQLEVLNLEQTCPKLHEILTFEEKVQKAEKAPEYLGYLKWLKKEITSEVYFTRYLWINNMKGKAYIDDAIERTYKAIQL